MEAIGGVIGGAVALFLIRLVPERVRYDLRWAPAFVGAMIAGVFLGIWLASFIGMVGRT